MKIKYHTIILLLIASITSCASTSITSYVDPEHASEKYYKPIVWGQMSSLTERKSLEESFVKKFKSIGIGAIPGVLVFKPTEELTKENIIPILTNTKGDSILIITYNGGDTFSFEAKLLGNNLKKVWVSHAITKLHQASFSDTGTLDVIFDSIADEIVNKLVSDKVIFPSVK